MSNDIKGEVPTNDGTGRALKYRIDKQAMEELKKLGIDVEAEVQQALLQELEIEKKLLDESPADKPQLIEDIRGGKRL